jgi:hypothetical protein
MVRKYEQILEKECETNGLYWIHLTQERDRWQAVVNAAMNLRVPLNTGTFLD